MHTGFLGRLLVAGDLLDQPLVAAVAGPLLEVQARDLRGDATEVGVGDIPRVLLPLLGVEGLGEMPRLGLLARRQHSHLLGHEHVGVASRGLQSPVVDPQRPGPDPPLDDRRQHLEGEISAVRALQVGEVPERDRRLRVPEGVCALRDVRQQGTDLLVGLHPVNYLCGRLPAV